MRIHQFLGKNTWNFIPISVNCLILHTLPPSLKFLFTSVDLLTGNVVPFCSQRFQCDNWLLKTAMCRILDIHIKLIKWENSFALLLLGRKDVENIKYFLFLSMIKFSRHFIEDSIGIFIMVSSELKWHTSLMICIWPISQLASYHFNAVPKALSFWCNYLIKSSIFMKFCN